MNKYERILLIDEIISSGCRPSQKDLINIIENRCNGINRSTIYRDLKDLETKFHAPLDVQDYVDKEGCKKRGYIYTEPKFRVPAMFSSADKVKSALLMSRLLEYVKGTPIYEEASEVFKELSTEAPMTNNRGEAKFLLDSSERIIFIGSPCIPISDSIWNLVKQSLQENKILNFIYQEKKRTVNPYQLIFSKGNWNLWCYEYSSKKEKLFKLSEMQNVEFKKGKETTFNLPMNFDFRNLTSGYFGTFVSDVNSVVKVKFKNYAATYTKCRIWGENQTVEEIDDVYTLISFETKQLDFTNDGKVRGPILTWLLSWGDDAIPIEPKELVDSWKDKIKSMLELASM